MCRPLPRRWLLAPPGQGYVELDIGTLRRALDGTLQHLLTGDFGLVRQLAFIGHDQLLLLERSGTRRLRCFDLVQYTEVDFSLAGGENWPSGPKAYCLNADQTRLAVLRGSWVELFEVASRQLVRRFRLQHRVKSAKLHFVGEALGVRTDAGCFSLYQL